MKRYLFLIILILTFNNIYSPIQAENSVQSLLELSAKPAAKYIINNLSNIGADGLNELLNCPPEIQEPILKYLKHFSIQKWPTQTGAHFELSQSYTKLPGPMFMTPDGQMIITAGRQIIKTFRLNEKNLFCEDKTLIGHTGWISSITATSDGKTIVSLCENTIIIWRLNSEGQFYPDQTITDNTGNTKSHIFLYMMPTNVSYVSISADGSTLVFIGGDKHVKVWQLNSDNIFHEHQIIDSNTRFYKITPDSQTLVSSQDCLTKPKILIWQLNIQNNQYQLKQIIETDQFQIESLIVTPDGKTIISADTYKIKIWRLDHASNQFESHKPIENKAVSILKSATTSYNGNTIVSTTLSKNINLWKYYDNEESFYLHQKLEGHTEVIPYVFITPDDQMIVSADRNQIIKIWRQQSNIDNFNLEQMLFFLSDH